MERVHIPASRDQAGRPLLWLSVAYVVLLIPGGSTVGAAFHIPHDSSAVAFMAANSWKIQWGSFCEFVSAIPLAIFFATTASRLRFLGITAAGPTVALLGGILASVMLIFSALCTWSLTRPGMAEATGAVRALQALGFDGGGPGFVVPLGLFVAGISVTAGVAKLIPRWLMWLSIVVALACELAALTLRNFTAGHLIPLGRFISIVWMIGLALTLPSSIRESLDERAIS
jgi:hypothetical protein